MDQNTYPAFPIAISQVEILPSTASIVDSDPNNDTGLNQLMAIAAMMADRRQNEQDVIWDEQLDRELETRSCTNSEASVEKVQIQQEFEQLGAGTSKKKNKNTLKSTISPKKRQKPNNSPTESGKETTQPKMKKVNTEGAPSSGRCSCDRCDRTFPCRAKLVEHARVVHDKVLLSCYICNATMKWSSNMKSHMFTKHNIGEAPIPKTIRRECQRCSIKFPSNKLLNKHLEEVHNEHQYFKCEVCGMQFDCQIKVHAHEKAEHSKGFYQCGTCRLRYRSLSVVTGHCRKYGHKIDEEKAKSNDHQLFCYKCKKPFANYNSFSCHVGLTNSYKVCNGPQYLRCKSCKIQFTLYKELAKHMADVHSKKISKKYKSSNAGTRPCKICGKVLSKSTDMTYHINMHKGIKNFKCDLCNFASYFPSSVRSHRKSHFGEMKYFCRTCGKGFKSKSLWRACEFIHTGKEPLECSKCGQQFITDISLEHHISGKVNKKKCPGRKDESAVGVPVKKITNQSVLHLMLRGDRIAQSVDETAIADFKKPRPRPKPKTVKRRPSAKTAPKKGGASRFGLEDGSSAKNVDQSGDKIAGKIDNFRDDNPNFVFKIIHPEPAEGAQDLNKGVRAQSTDQIGDAIGCEEIAGTSAQVNTPSFATGAEDQIKDAKSQAKPTTLSRSGDDEIRSEDILGTSTEIGKMSASDWATHVKQKEEEAKSNIDRLNLKAEKEIQQEMAYVQKCGTKPRRRRHFKLKRTARTEPLSAKELKMDWGNSDWREKRGASTIYWKEVSVEEVVHSINEAVKNAPNPDLDREIFDEIVFS